MNLHIYIFAYLFFFIHRGAIDGLYAEFFKLPAEEFIRTEKKRRIIITTFWFFSSLFFAIYTPNIGVIIELLGSLASANVFMFPSLCLIKITQRKDQKLSSFYKVIFYIFSIFLILSGILTFGIVLYQVYEDLVTEKLPTQEVLCK
jgi:putative sodium-coupled neutral amino acid transporter 7